MTTWVAALAAGLAVLLAAPVAARSGRSPTFRLRRVRAGPGLVALAAGVVATLLVTVEGIHLALALVGLGAAAGAGLVVGRARAATAADRRRRLVVEVCEALVGELRAGQPLVASLEHCASVWPDLHPVVAAARLGADVPAAMRRLGREPGAEGLREVAAAWQVSQTSGAGLAAALTQVSRTARERQSTRHLVQGELASAQATARLVALLPVASLAMSAGIGGDPWHFLLGTVPGVACLAAGVGFALAGLLWIDRIATAVLRG